MVKFVPRQRKQKARQRSTVAATSNASASDSNTIELLPASKAEREERRRNLRDELRAQQPPSKGSSKKKKRLDKYIDIKLKKEENLDLIKKLASHKVDTSLFRSSKKLGRGSESKRERYGRVLREQRAGIGEEEERNILMQRRRDVDDEEEETSDNLGAAAIIPTAPGPGPALQPLLLVNVLGAGLKRPLEIDSAGNPIIKRRKRTKSRPKRSSMPPDSTLDDSDWEGFSSQSEHGSSTFVRMAGDGQLADEDTHESGSESSGDFTSDTSVDGDDVSEGYSSDASADGEIDPDDSGKDGLLRERSSAFKAWATQQRNDALGFIPSTPLDLPPVSDEAEFSNRPVQSLQGLQQPQTLNLAGQKLSRRADDAVETSTIPLSTARRVFNVSVTRSREIEEVRHALPVVAEEQKIMEAIHDNDCVIIWGATGSGKTTQVPQFLFEAGYGSTEGPTPGMIGITQPRRVAAVSMAQRVATELGTFKDRVAHQIRFDSSVNKNTAIKFMTDGVLLREISQDFTLSKYSAIVLDEAHERSVNTDLLIGMLSRIVETRSDLAKKSAKYKPLKLVIMSATLRTADLTNNKALFRKGSPPIVQAEGRQYPVTIHFTRRTERDYLEETFGKVSRGHKKLPAGGILVFLTGQNEITTIAKRLKQAFASTDGIVRDHSQVRISAAEASIENEDIELDGLKSGTGEYQSDSDTDIRGVDNDVDKEFDIGNDPGELLQIHVLPLYSQLPTDQQMRIFQPVPEGSRLIVLATNVAETSLTIPGIRYVFDCGRAKEKLYDRATGVQNFEVGWISKASAGQRAGRAGRTGPGHCYRLYSSAVYERDFAEFAEPEITRMPIEGVVLQLKSMGIPNIATFPFPTAPDREALLKAEHLLEYLGAISDGVVTTAGKDLSVYPLSPRLSRMLCIAQGQAVIDHGIALVSALAVSDVFIAESQLNLQELEPAGEDERWTEADYQEARLREQRRKDYNTFHGNLSRMDRMSDAVKLLTTICDFTRRSVHDLDPFTSFARIKALDEVTQLRRQLTTIVATHHPGITNTSPTVQLPEPTKAQVGILRQVVAAGYIDQVAVRADLSPTPPETLRKPKRAIDVPYITLFPSSPDNGAVGIADPDTLAKSRYVYIHPSSVLAHVSPDKLPQYLIYSHLSRSAPSTVSTSTATTTKPPKTRLHPLTPVTAPQLVALAAGTPLLEDGKPVGKIEQLDRDGQGRERRACLVVPFLRGQSGAQGWPLPPARRVLQVRVAGKGWVAE